MPRMSLRCVLLLCAVQTASALGVHVSNADMTAHVKYDIGQLRDDTTKVQELQQELAEMDGADANQDPESPEQSEEDAVAPATDDEDAGPAPQASLLAKADPDPAATVSEHTEEIPHLAAPEVAAQKENAHMSAKDRYFRPGLESGKVDEVSFGLRLKRFYGIDFLNGAFTVDGILTTKWRDDRAKDLLPPNAATVRLGLEDAKKLMWLPDVQVTNIAKAVDTLSASILVDKSGTITKVSRMLMTLKQGYDTKDFPFDTQTINIRMASRTYMSDELKLTTTEDKEHTLIHPDLFASSAWNYKKSSQSSYIDDDGILKKSRGLCAITVKRVSTQFMSSIFIPSMILLVMTWCTLWFPFGTTFVMPRVAVSVISVLCMMALLRISMKLSPASRSWTWLGQYLEICVELQFLLMVSNSLFLSMYHRKGAHENELAKNLADTLDNELIVGYPIFGAVILACVFGGYIYVARAVFLGTIVSYVAFIGIRMHRLNQIEENAELLGDEVSGQKSQSFVA